MSFAYQLNKCWVWRSPCGFCFRDLIFAIEVKSTASINNRRSTILLQHLLCLYFIYVSISTVVTSFRSINFAENDIFNNFNAKVNTSIINRGSKNASKNRINESNQSENHLGVISSINKGQKKSLSSRLENKKTTLPFLRSKPVPSNCPIVKLPSVFGTKRQRCEGSPDSKVGGMRV